MSIFLALATGIASTQSAQVVAESQVSRFESLVAVAGYFTQGLIGIITLMLGFIGFLTWKQHELRKQAEKEIEAIVKNRKNADKVYKEFLSLFKEISKQAKVIKKASKEAKGAVSNIKVKGKKVEAQITKAREALQELDESTNNLVTTSGTVALDNDFIRNINTSTFNRGVTFTGPKDDESFLPGFERTTPQIIEEK